jgi:hypothetical protein
LFFFIVAILVVAIPVSLPFCLDKVTYFHAFFSRLENIASPYGLAKVKMASVAAAAGAEKSAESAGKSLARGAFTISMTTCMVE